MAFADIIRTVFEFTAVILLIVGFINEKKVIAFEAKLARAIKIHLRNRRRRKQAEIARAYASSQSRAPADIEEVAPVIAISEAKKFVNHVA